MNSSHFNRPCVSRSFCRTLQQRLRTGGSTQAGAVGLEGVRLELAAAVRAAQQPRTCASQVVLKPSNCSSGTIAYKGHNHKKRHKQVSLLWLLLLLLLLLVWLLPLLRRSSSRLLHFFSRRRCCYLLLLLLASCCCLLGSLGVDSTCKTQPSSASTAPGGCSSAPAAAAAAQVSRI